MGVRVVPAKWLQRNLENSLESIVKCPLYIKGHQETDLSLVRITWHHSKWIPPHSKYVNGTWSKFKFTVSRVLDNVRGSAVPYLVEIARGKYFGYLWIDFLEHGLPPGTEIETSGIETDLDDNTKNDSTELSDHEHVLYLEQCMEELMRQNNEILSLLREAKGIRAKER